MLCTRRLRTGLSPALRHLEMEIGCWKVITFGWQNVKIGTASMGIMSRQDVSIAFVLHLVCR